MSLKYSKQIDVLTQQLEQVVERNVDVLAEKEELEKLELNVQRNVFKSWKQTRDLCAHLLRSICQRQQRNQSDLFTRKNFGIKLPHRV